MLYFKENHRKMNLLYPSKDIKLKNITLFFSKLSILELVIDYACSNFIQNSQNLETIKMFLNQRID